MRDARERPAAQTEFQCRVFTRFDELQQLCSDWRRLQSGLSRPEIFLHLDWIAAWWRSFGHRYELVAPVLSRAGQVVAILPLVRQGSRLMYLGHSVADYCDFLHDGEDPSRALALALDGLLDYTRSWDVIEFSNVPETSRLAAAINELGERWRSRIDKSAGNPCPTLSFGADKQQALASVLAKDKLKKAVRYLGRRGELRFHHIEDKADFEVHFEEFMRQHIRRSAIAGRRSAFLNDDYVGFYRGLVETFGLKSEIRFSVLEVGDSPVAYHFGTLFASKYLFYKPTFDVDYWDLSPGQVLLWYLLDYCRTADVNEFDFGQGGESYKYRFANEVRQNMNYTLYAPRISASTLRLRARAVESVKAQIQRSPMVKAQAERSKQSIRDMHLAFRRTGLGGVVRMFGERIAGKRETRALVRIPVTSVRARSTDQYRIDEATLATLADASVSAPAYLTEEILQEARKRLARKEKAWILFKNESARAVLWTSDKLSMDISFSPADAASLFVCDIHALVTEFDRHDFVAAAYILCDRHRGFAESVYVWCHDRLVPRDRDLQAAGMNRVPYQFSSNPSEG